MAGQRMRRAAGAVAGVLVVAIVLEVWLRAFGPFLPGSYRTGPLYAPDPELGWRLEPNAVVWFKQPDFTNRVEVNAQGRLGPLVDERRPEVTRIVVLGDSFVASTEVPYERSLTGRLGRLIANDLPSEVVNAGVGSYGIDQAVLLFEGSIRALDPDLVVLVFVVSNDVWDGHPPLQRGAVALPKPSFEIDDAGRLVPRKLDPATLSIWDRLRQVFNRSALLTVIKSGIIDPLSGVPQTNRRIREEQLRGTLGEPSGEWARAWEITSRLIERMAEDARMADVPLLLFVAPDACQVHADRCAGSSELSTSTLPQSRLVDVARSAGVDVVEPLATFREHAARGTQLYFRHDLHWTEEGHDLAARVLADWIKTRYVRRTER